MCFINSLKGVCFVGTPGYTYQLTLIQIKVISLVSNTMLLACEDLPSVIDQWTEVRSHFREYPIYIGCWNKDIYLLLLSSHI